MAGRVRDRVGCVAARLPEREEPGHLVPLGRAAKVLEPFETRSYPLAEVDPLLRRLHLAELLLEEDGSEVPLPSLRQLEDVGEAHSRLVPPAALIHSDSILFERLINTFPYVRDGRLPQLSPRHCLAEPPLLFGGHGDYRLDRAGPPLPVERDEGEIARARVRGRPGQGVLCLDADAHLH